MMRRVFLFLFGFIVSLVANADQVTEQQALQKAQQFMKGKNLTLSWSKSFARSDHPKDDQAFYIFNAENNEGFVIISGDDRTPAILGYSDSGEFRTENMPDNVRYWLDGYTTQINALQEGKSYARSSRTRGALPAIEPLIKTQWNQYEPYNRMCPMDGENRSVTGCVAACAAQILYYHQWPESSPSLPAYTTSTKKYDMPELPATTFNYAKMQTTYSWDETDNEASRDEVAKLFRYCGQAMHMDYTSSGSAAYLSPTVLKDVFRYTWRTREVSRESYSEEVWDQMMYDELKNNRPVPYSGGSDESGHQFILDGYKDELFHINWGWGGWCDGYFILSLCNPYQPEKTATDGGYYKRQAAIINLVPGKYEKNVTVGSFQYICDTKEKTAVVVNGDYSELTEIIIPASIKDNGVTYQVTEIAEYTFCNLWNIKKVDLPSTLVTIGDYAFASCSNLTSVICRMKKPIAINENVFTCTNYIQNEETGDWDPIKDFSKATLYVPEGTTSLYQKAAVWKKFPQIYEGELKEATVDGLNYSYVTGSKIATVISGDYQALESVTIPSTISVDGVKYKIKAIDNRVFQGCKMKSLTLSKNLEIIGDYAFSYCYSLEQVAIPEGVKTIGGNAFLYGSMKKLVLPSSLSTIGEYAFSGLSNLNAVVVAASEPLTINENVFSNSNWVKKEDSDEWKEVIEFTKATLYVPEGCTAAYKKAAVWKKFSPIYEGEPKEATVDGLNYSYVTGSKIATVLSGDYQALESVTIPSTITVDGVKYKVKAIDKQVFQYCNNIKSLTLSKNLEIIGDYAFSNCNNIEQVSIPEGVKTIGSYAFGNLSNLNAVVIAASEPLSIDESVFSNTTWGKNEETGEWKSFLEFTKATLYVPEGCTAAYQKAAVWKKFSPIYEGEPKEATVDGLNYSYVTGSKIATVLSGDYQTLESVTIPSTITVDDVKYKVKAIDKQVFQYCNNIKSLTLSKNLEIIGDNAFSYCNNIEQVSIPEGVKTIGNRAFQSCYSLKKLELPSSISSIGEYAFSGLSNLNAVVIAALEPMSIDESVFSTTTWVKNDETDEWKEVMEFTKATLYVPEGSSSKYKKAAVWKNFSPIYEGEQKETTVGGLNYSYVTGSKVAMVLPGDYSAMDTVKIPSTITVDEIKYKVKAIEKNAFYYCNSIKSLSLPNGLERIGDYTFYGCSSIEKLVIPKTVKTIGHFAFSNNYVVTSITIPEGVTSVGNYAFVYCYAVKEVELPTTLTSLGEGAFSSCTSLEKVVAKMKMPIDIQKEVFSTTSWVPNEETGEDEYISEFTNATLYVPYGKKKEYKKASGWKEFAKIVEMEPTVGDLIPITIGSSGKSTYCSKYDLDFSKTDDVKAYVATGYEADGTVWLTRIKQVPAGTSVLIKGEAEKTYEMLILNKCAAYFENMFQGSADEDLGISTTTEDGMHKNFYMSKGQFKPISDKGQTIKAGKCYLQVPASFKASKAGKKQTVKIADSGKSSYAPPVDVDLTEVEGLKAYAATGYDAASSTIWLTRINKIQAGEGVLLKGEAGKTYTLPSAATQAYYGNMIIGNIGDPITINETSDDGEWKNFYLASGSYKPVSGTREIGTNKSYLHLPTSLLVSSARGKEDAGTEEWLMEELETEFMLLGSIEGDDEDGMTRIDAIGNENAQSDNDTYYNLQGQRIDNPKKGLYIRNGKKVIIR